MNISTLEPETIMEEAMAKSQRLVEQLRILLVYQDIITGKGLEFERLRQYVPGDEARMIDWNSLARTNKLYTKIFKEERMMDVIIVVDISDTMTVGTTKRLKNEYASIIATTMSQTALDAGDQVGLVAFAEDEEVTLQPSYDDEIPYQIATSLSDPEIYGGQNNWNKLSQNVLGTYGQDTFVFVISDFIGEGTDMYEFILQCNEKFRGVFAFMVRDPTDSYLPEGIGKAYLSDPETGEIDLVDVDQIRDKYNEKARNQEATARRKIESTGGHFFKIHTDEEFVDEFAAYLDERSDQWK